MSNKRDYEKREYIPIKGTQIVLILNAVVVSIYSPYIYSFSIMR